MPPMNTIDTIHMLGMPPEDTIKRLKQGGLDLLFYPAQFAAMAGEYIAENHNSSSSRPLMLGVDSVPPELLSWKDIAPGQADLAAGGSIPPTDAIMQAVVQYNRRQVLLDNQQQPTLTAEAAAGATVSNNGSSPDPQQQPLLVVGYVMKASREDALAAAGLLNLLPQDGMCFMPVDLDTLTASTTTQQQQHIDILLHKGSDELVPLASEGSSSANPASAAAAGAVDAGTTPSATPCPAAAVGVSWSPRLRALQSWLAQHPHICVVDPFQHTAKVLDRLLLAQLLQGLSELQLPGGVRARGPGFVEAQCFDQDLVAAVTAAGLQPPFIVKPRVACGVSHSHSMALVLSTAALQQLQGQTEQHQQQQLIPTPALVQEFINHGALQYKVYVMGEQVFVTPRASIPDIHIGAAAVADDSQEQQQQQQYLLFDSLASLPTQLPAHLTQPQQQQQDGSDSTPPAAAAAAAAAEAAAPSEEVLKAMAAFLREHLGLTLFGFDVVVAAAAAVTPQQQQQSQQLQQQQELIVIDVNYFPNYRGGAPDTPAKFRAALRQAWSQHQHQQLLARTSV